MKKILSFEEFVNESLNESYSSTDTSIIDRTYKNGDPTSLKNFKTKFLKGDDFDMGGVIHIHGSIKGSLAVETKTIDVYHFNEDDPEVMNLTTWTCVDNIKGGDSGWKMIQKTNVDFSKEVENLLNISSYDSSDYTERFVVLYENPDYKMKSNTFILESALNEAYSDKDAYKAAVDILKTLHGFSDKIRFSTEDVNRHYNIVYDDPKDLTGDCLKGLKSNKFWNTEFAPSTGKFENGRVNIRFDKSAQEILNIENFDKKDWSPKPY